MLVFEADRPTRPTWNINTYLIFTRWYMETALFLWIVISFIITELRSRLILHDLMVSAEITQNNAENNNDNVMRLL